MDMTEACTNETCSQTGFPFNPLVWKQITSAMVQNQDWLRTAGLEERETMNI